MTFVLFQLVYIKFCPAPYYAEMEFFLLWSSETQKISTDPQSAHKCQWRIPESLYKRLKYFTLVIFVVPLGPPLHGPLGGPWIPD